MREEKRWDGCGDHQTRRSDKKSRNKEEEKESRSDSDRDRDSKTAIFRRRGGRRGRRRRRVVKFDVHVKEPLDEDGRGARVIEKDRDAKDQKSGSKDGISLLEDLEGSETIVERIECICGAVDGEFGAS